MSRTSDGELERLFSASVDGLLSEPEESALSERLRNDAAARRLYLRFMQLHAELHWDHGVSAALLVESSFEAGATPADGPSRDDVRRANRATWYVLALMSTAAGVLLAITISLLRDRATPAVVPSTIATVESVQGAVIFRSAHEEQLLVDRESQALSAGTLLLEGEDSAVQCRLLDGTLIMLTGDAEAHIADDGRKRIRLSRGLLTAEVQPQSAAAPMLVETPTARVEVLGTVVTLSAEPDRTSVRVDSGRVRMARLVDGREVEVARDHACVASLDAREELRPHRTSAAASHWRQTFVEPPPSRWKGQWQAPVGDEPGRMRAVPCVVGRKDEAMPVVHFGVSVRRVEGVDLGQLPADGTLWIKYRLERPSPLRIMLGVNRGDGRFGGNFEVKLGSKTTVVAEDRWQWLEIPLSRLKPLVSRFPEMAEGDRPYLILFTTFEDDGGLEIAELGITETGITELGITEPEDNRR